MKIKTNIFGLISSFLVVIPFLVSGYDRQHPPHGWINGNEVIVEGNDLYMDTNDGRVLLTVIQYDAAKDRYLVECIPFGGEFYEPRPSEFEEDLYSKEALPEACVERKASE